MTTRPSPKPHINCHLCTRTFATVDGYYKHLADYHDFDVLDLEHIQVAIPPNSSRH